MRPWDSLVEVCFGDGQEAAVSLGPHGEDEGLSGQHGQLAHQLPGVRHKQARLLLAVDHALVDVEQARDHKLDAHLLRHKGVRFTNINNQISIFDIKAQLKGLLWLDD